MTTKKSKKGLVKGKAEMIKEVFEFFQFSVPTMPNSMPNSMPDSMPDSMRMRMSNLRPQGRSGSDNVPNLQEHLRKKKLVSGVRKKRGRHSKLDT